MKNQDLITYQLINSQPEIVFEWLQSNLPNKLCGYWEDRHVLEESLLRLNNPLITMGLARFGLGNKVAKEIYATGGPILKKAVISGPSIAGHPNCWLNELNVIETLLNTKNLELLLALISSSYLPVSTLKDLYERSGKFKGIDDDLFIELIGYSSCDPNLPYIFSERWVKSIVDPISSFSTEGYELDFTDVYKRSQMAWGLFEVLPATPKAAAKLSCLSKRILRAKPYEFDVFKNIEKWKTPKGAVEDFERGWFEECRTALGQLLEGDALKGLREHHDPALRKSYYSAFKFDNPTELQSLKQKDGELFVDSALDNIWLYRSLGFREALLDCCRGFDCFSWRSEQLSKIMVRWYLDALGDGELHTRHIEDPVEAQSFRIEEIERLIKRLSLFLKGEKIGGTMGEMVEEISKKQDEIKLQVGLLFKYLSVILIILIWLVFSR